MEQVKTSSLTKEYRNERGQAEIPYHKVLILSQRVHKAKTATKSTRGKICAWCLTDTTPEWRKGPNKESFGFVMLVDYNTITRERQIRNRKKSFCAIAVE
mmetsp:Transcript_8956/g.12326  ORF Transcript_8956/g.12326 Transcript_8956/m.12326 type:complete len:100 (+) Transcript_8956:596-895(+)